MVEDAYSYPPELLYRLHDGFEFLDGCIHRVLLEIHVLRDLEDFGRRRAWNRDDAIGVSSNDVAGAYRDTVARDRKVRTSKAVMPHRGRRHNAKSEDREADFLQVSHVPHAAVDNRSGEISNRHRGAHQTSHSGNIGAIFDN